MKTKILSILLATALLGALTGCGTGSVAAKVNETNDNGKEGESTLRLGI